MSKRISLWVILLASGFLANTSVMGAQSESPVACNEAAEPVILVYGDHTTGCEINPSTDLDGFNFDGTSGDVVRITLRTTAALGGRVELFDPGSGTIIVDTFCNAFGGGCSVTVDETLSSTGSFGIAISDNGTDQTGSYTLQLERIPPVVPPQPLDFNVTAFDNILPTTDLDFFTFNANAGNLVRMTVVTSAALGGRLEIRDPNGVVIFDSFCNAFGGGCTITTDQTLAVAGTYVVGVSDNGIDQTGSYQINLQCLIGPCPLPTTRAECDIELNQTSFIDGETVTLDVFRIANLTGADLKLEWKLWLGIPGAAPASLINVGADGSFTLPDGTDVDGGPVPLLPVTAALPRGGYELSCRFLDPLTGRLLMEDRNLFDIQ